MWFDSLVDFQGREAEWLEVKERAFGGDEAALSVVRDIVSGALGGLVEHGPFDNELQEAVRVWVAEWLEAGNLDDLAEVEDLLTADDFNIASSALELKAANEYEEPVIGVPVSDAKPDTPEDFAARAVKSASGTRFMLWRVRRGLFCLVVERSDGEWVTVKLKTPDPTLLESRDGLERIADEAVTANTGTAAR